MYVAKYEQLTLDNVPYRLAQIEDFLQVCTGRKKIIRLSTVRIPKDFRPRLQVAIHR